jgi:hypothetical protein
MTDGHKRDHHDKGGDRNGASKQPAPTSTYDRTLGKATQTLESSREFAADAARRTAASLDSNPLGIVVGGLALGVVAGALLPRSDKERELLAPVGAKLGEKARGAINAAKEVGKTELENRGISRDAARDQVKNLFDGVVQALSAAGAAAAKSTAGGTASASDGQKAEATA